ncbi:MAG: amino acid ABC transporter substrate-binding protein [Anaerotruncus sp.]|nr:amino acid ABC transporter substrate-binding protein [Anaerotruncus sp.]
MKKILTAILALTMTAALTACGGSASSQAPASSVPAPASSEPASSEAASSEPASSEIAAETPNIDRIKSAGKIVMCTNLAFPPFEYVDDNGEAAGVDVDISKEIAKDLGVELEIIDMNFDLIIDSVKTGKADFSAAGMTIKPERLEQIDFSDEYVKSAQYVIIKAGSGVTADKLDGLVIGVQEQTTGDFYATDEIQAKDVLRFKSGIEAGMALQAGKCDAVIIDKLPAESIAANSNGELETLPDSLTEESYAIAIKKDSPDLVAAINATLARLTSEGKIDELVTKHMTEA